MPINDIKCCYCCEIELGVQLLGYMAIVTWCICTANCFVNFSMAIVSSGETHYDQYGDLVTDDEYAYGLWAFMQAINLVPLTIVFWTYVKFIKKNNA